MLSLNLNNNSQGTICQQLFNNDAEKIFYLINIKDKKSKRDFVDECLKISMRVCSFIFQKEDALFLFSCAIAANEACPLYSHRIVQIKKTYHLKTEAEKLELTPDNRFLLLSFFLNTILLSDIHKCFSRVFRETMGELGIEPPTPKKYFNMFLQDDGKCREYASRTEYNRLFESHMKQSLLESNSSDPLYTELNRIAHEDLVVEYKNFRGLKLYSYPIFPALVYLERKIKEDGITVFFKIKVITREGTEGLLVKKIGDAVGKSPVLVFNGIGTDGSFGIPYYRYNGLTCPNNYFCVDDPRFLHNKTETCFYCKPSSNQDPSVLKLFQERVDKATSDFQTLFYALGADSAKVQDRFLHFFKDGNKYPVLTNIFESMQSKIKELGLDMNRPLAFSIATVHVNTAEREESSKFYLDTVPEYFIENMFKK